MSKTLLLPLDAGKFIAKKSSHVFIKKEGVKTTAEMIVKAILNHQFGIEKWKEHTLNPKIADEAAIDWIFLADLLNFSFWSEDESNKCKIVYKGQYYTGYWSLCAAINRAIDEGVNITDPSYYQNLTLDDVHHFFHSDTDNSMPMLEERLEHMIEAGAVLTEKYNGSFVNCITKCNHSSQKLLELLVTEFSSFRDEAEYRGQKVSFYKRAQILIADIWACFEGKGYGRFDDIDTITMFADYRIPQALTYFNILTYSPELQELLEEKHLFKSGDLMEVELRGCSIWATHLLTEAVKECIDASEDSGKHTINSILIDHFIWDYRRAHDKQTQHIPFHRIRCRYY